MKPVGTAFAEIDLDSTKLEQGLKRVNTQLVSGSIKVEDAYKSLGLKSDQVYNMMKANATAALDFIKNKTLSSKEEVLRAEQAAANKIKAINEQQYGAHVSMIDNIKKHWIAASVAIYAAYAVISKAWRLAEMAAGYEESLTALNNFAAQYKSTATEIVADIKEITRGQIAMVDIAKISTKALALNIPLEKYKELAKYADAVGDALSMSTTQALEMITEAAEKGTSKVMKQIVGVVDLDAKYGNLTATMTDQQKVTAMTDLLIEKLSGKYGDLGNAVTSNADKMEQLTAAVKDLQLHLGTVLIRSVLGLAGAFQWLAAGVMNAVGALASFGESFTALGKILFPLGGILKSMGVDSATAFETAEELAGKAVENFKAMTASSKDLAKAMATTKTPDDKNKKWLDDMKLATMDWKVKIDALNPALDETDKQLNDLIADAAKLTEKWGKQDWIKGGLESGTAFIIEKKDYEARKAYMDSVYEIDKKMKDDRLKGEIELNQNMTKIRNEEFSRQLSIAENTIKLSEDIVVRKAEISGGELAGQLKKYDIEKQHIMETMQAKLSYTSLSAKEILQIEKEKYAALMDLDLRYRDALLASSGTLIDGLKEGFRVFKLSVKTEHEQIRDITVKAFNSMADALADFVMTGKMNFKDLANSIIRDLIRIQIQESMVKSMGGLFKIIGKLFGIGGAAAPALSLGGGIVNPAWAVNIPTIHKGGIVGVDSFPTKSVPVSTFASAPRLHSGLFSDEFPAILQKGEEVIPKNRAGRKESTKEELTINNYHYYDIKAVNAKSFFDLCRTNPEAISEPVMQRLRDNKTRLELKSLLR